MIAKNQETKNTTLKTQMKNIVSFRVLTEKEKVENKVFGLLDLSNIKTEFGEIHNGVLKLKNIDIEKFSTKDFKQKITDIFASNPKIKEIDFSSLGNKERAKQKLFEIIGKNYPALEVSRLIEGQRIVDMSFFGIKYLNDNISKEFVDLFVEDFKSHINKNFSQIIAGENPGRVVRQDYKHMTFSMRKDLDINTKIFGKREDNKKLFEKVFESMDYSKLEKSLVGTKKEGWLSDPLKKEELKQILLKHFDIGVGDSIISGKTLEEKLVSFYEAEIASKTKADLKNLGENISYKFEKTSMISESVFKMEKNIVEKYKGQKFEVNGVKYDVLFQNDISPILLRDVRKGENIGNKELQKEVQNYINELNSGFDFISPMGKGDSIAIIDNLENQIHNLKISSESILKNHKLTYTKEALEMLSAGKEGIRVFIDIVDMGIMNLRDFRILAHKVHSGEITEKNMMELLKAGDTATKRFGALVERINRDFPGSHISLGGDEVSIFIPGKTPLETNDILKKISTSLEYVDLKGRISSSFSKDISIFDELDSKTSINKMFEKKMEGILQKEFGKIEKINIRNTVLEGDKSISDIKSILQKIGDEKLNSSLKKLMRNNPGYVNLEGMQIFAEGNTLKIKF